MVGIEKLPGVKGLTYPWKNHLCRQPCKTYAIDLKQEENFIIPERNTKIIIMTYLYIVNT